MKKKIANIVVDLLLITAVFGATDVTTRQVFQSESMWVELGIYMVFYAVVFGAKRGMITLWKRLSSRD